MYEGPVATTCISVGRHSFIPPNVTNMKLQ